MVYITVLLYIFEGAQDAFQEYESLALPLLSAHNGKVHLRIRCVQDVSKNFEEQPYEVHVLAFKTEGDFENYLGDSRRKSLDPLRNKVIKSTTVLKGHEV